MQPQYRICKLLIPFLAIILAFSGSAFAQIEPIKYFPPVDEGFCRMKECKAKDANLYFQIVDFRKAAGAIFAETNRVAHFGYSLKNDPATERDTGFRFLKPASNTMKNQKSVPMEQLDKKKDSSLQYRSFRNGDRGLGAKLRRAAILTQSAQMTNLLSMVAFSNAFNASCSSFDDAKRNLRRAWTSPPIWDKDPGFVNYAGHPYAGSYYYNMLRSQGSSSRTSFLYSTAQSLIWEFVIEAVSEQPSIQDLLVTSNLGSVLGEFAHQSTIRMSRNGFSAFEKILTMLIDPAYVLNNGFKKQH
jgi:hypothetical protein